MTMRITPSILNADLANLSGEIARIPGADGVHIDVMDNRFVPNLTLGLPVVECVRASTTAFLDIHLMIAEVDRWAPGYADAGCESVTFHVEASDAPIKLARELRWEIVPPTVERDGPLGPGSVQFFVPARFEEHYFTFKDVPEHRRSLRQLCTFDLVSNNTDRKGGHILLSDNGHLWGIDHGLSFHEEFKLRTVMWDYAGEPIETDLIDDVARWLEADPSAALSELLSEAEIAAMRDRANAVIAGGHFPHDPTGRRYPWPLV